MDYDDPFEVMSSEPQLRLIIFALQAVQFALPIESVYQVIRRPAVLTSGLSGIGIAHLGEQAITVLDLHYRFFQTASNAAAAGYLILIQPSAGEILGIPVEAVPGMLDIPYSTIRLLPEAYRQRDSFGLASRFAVLEDAEEPLTLFILDLHQLMVQAISK